MIQLAAFLLFAGFVGAVICAFIYVDKWHDHRKYTMNGSDKWGPGNYPQFLREVGKRRWTGRDDSAYNFGDNSRLDSRCIRFGDRHMRLGFVDYWRAQRDIKRIVRICKDKPLVDWSKEE